jgi:3-phenylpropionate/trans-cinnamate dioxygenase ferredoxin reductase component
MTSQRTFVIVGASLAGAKAAETLRAEGFDGRIVLIGAEPVRPYERPPLSKDYLRGEAEAPPFVHGEAFYGEQQIELVLGHAVTRLRADEGRVELDDGRAVDFDAALLTTGAEPRALPVPGADLEGVYLLRSLQDSDAIAARLQEGGRVVIVGAGWIGCEVAASARQKGLEVTVIEPQSAPLERVLGAELGGYYARLHSSHGVDLRLAEGLAHFEGDGRVRAAVTSSGDEVPCDFVLVGIGVAPRTALAAEAGLAVDNGVLTDARLQTSAPTVFAAGDVANAEHPFYGTRVRVEHWANALEQGPAAARAMLGADSRYELLPFFFSDQYDSGMEYRGHMPEGYDEVVVRGDVDSGEFIAFWLKGDVVQAGMNVNVWDVGDDVEALIRSRARVDRGALADPDTPLQQLAASGGSAAR